MISQRRDLSRIYYVSIHPSLCSGKGYGDSGIGVKAYDMLEKQAIKMGLDKERPLDWEELIPFDANARKFAFIQERKDAWIIKGMEKLQERFK